MPIRAAQPKRLSRGEYWRRKIRAAESHSDRLSEACDYLRAMAAAYPDRQVAEDRLKSAADDLIEKARELGRRVR